MFGQGIVNRINPSRQMNYGALAQFQRLRKANWALIAAAADDVSASPERAEAGFRQAIANFADYARLRFETGLFAELSSEVSSNADLHLNGSDLAALDRLTLLLKNQSRWQELSTVIREFFTLYPETREQAIAKRVLKRCR